jgi:DNA-binding NarL/FixJ family response regulator
MGKIRLLIAEDSEEICKYFKKSIEKEEDMEVAGIAMSGAEAVEKTLNLNPDVVLMDIQMETKTAGIDAIDKIKKSTSAAKIIVLTIHSRDDLLFKAYAAGAMDYIIKTSPIEDVLKSIRAVMSNTLMLRPEISNKLIGEYRRIKEERGKIKEVLKVMIKITNTEFEIIKLVYNGYTYREIAELRFVEETTIRSEIYWILKKFTKKKMKDVIKLLQEIKFFETFDLN